MPSASAHSRETHRGHQWCRWDCSFGMFQRMQRMGRRSVDSRRGARPAPRRRVASPTLSCWAQEHQRRTGAVPNADSVPADSGGSGGVGAVRRRAAAGSAFASSVRRTDAARSAHPPIRVLRGHAAAAGADTLCRGPYRRAPRSTRGCAPRGTDSRNGQRTMCVQSHVPRIPSTRPMCPERPTAWALGCRSIARSMR